MNKTLRNVLLYGFGLLSIIYLKDIISYYYSNSKGRSTAWDEASTKVIYDSLYKGYGNVYSDSDKSKLSHCVVVKFTSKYPNGFKDSDLQNIKSVTALFTKQCVAELKLRMRWSPALITKIKENFNKSKWIQTIKGNYQSGLCDCFVNHLQSMYPNGIDSITRNDRDSAIMFCADRFKNKSK